MWCGRCCPSIILDSELRIAMTTYHEANIIRCYLHEYIYSRFSLNCIGRFSIYFRLFLSTRYSQRNLPVLRLPYGVTSFGNKKMGSILAVNSFTVMCALRVREVSNYQWSQFWKHYRCGCIWWHCDITGCAVLPLGLYLIMFTLWASICKSFLTLLLTRISLLRK